MPRENEAVFRVGRYPNVENTQSHPQSLIYIKIQKRYRRIVTEEELQLQMTDMTKIIARKVNTWQTCDGLMIVLVCDHDNRHLTRPSDKWWIHHTTHEVSDIYHSICIPCALYLHTRNIIVSSGFTTTESSRECYASRLWSDYKIYFLVKE